MLAEEAERALFADATLALWREASSSHQFVERAPIAVGTLTVAFYIGFSVCAALAHIVGQRVRLCFSLAGMLHARGCAFLPGPVSGKSRSG